MDTHLVIFFTALAGCLLVKVYQVHGFCTLMMVGVGFAVTSFVGKTIADNHARDGQRYARALEEKRRAKDEMKRMVLELYKAAQ